MSTFSHGRLTGPLLRRAFARALEGDRVWGGVDVWPSRNGVIRYRLTVYPPGASSHERRDERLWRGWRTASPIVWLAEFLTLSALGPVWRAAATATALSAVGCIFTALTTWKRARPVRLSALKVFDASEPRTIGPYEDLRRYLMRLEAADDALVAGRITAAQHEAAWADVWGDVTLAAAASPTRPH